VNFKETIRYENALSPSPPEDFGNGNEREGEDGKKEKVKTRTLRKVRSMRHPR
jgi:hypothetical protein